MNDIEQAFALGYTISVLNAGLSTILNLMEMQWEAYENQNDDELVEVLTEQLILYEQFNQLLNK